VRAAPHDDHGPELRPRDGRPDPLDPNANGRAIEPPEPTDERPNEARSHDSTPGVGTTDPRAQGMEADEPGISWRLADALVHGGRIAPDARSPDVHLERDRRPRTGVQRPPHSPLNLGPGEAVRVEQPAALRACSSTGLAKAECRAASAHRPFSPAKATPPTVTPRGTFPLTS
jgi:hypothetical protein